MKRFFIGMIVGMVLAGSLAAAADQASNLFYAGAYHRSLTYFRDDRTGLCFVAGVISSPNSSAFTYVPCETVKEWLWK